MTHEVNASPKVSVILPVYNSEKYLSQCLDSLIKQTLQGVQIIAVNDASHDDSLDVLNAYAAKYPDRIIVVDSPRNRGPGAARNLGVEIATGEYLAFVDPDDWVDLGMFEACYHTAIAYRADIVDCDYNEYYGEGRALNVRVAVPGALSGQANHRIRDERVILAVQNLTAKIVRRALFEEHNIRIPESYVAEDQIMVYIRFLADVCAKVDEPLYYYRREGESSTRVRNSTRLLEIGDPVGLVIQKLEQSHLHETHRDAIEFFRIRKSYRQRVIYACFYFDRPSARDLRGLRNELTAANPTWRSNPFYKRLSVQDRVILRLNEISPALLAVFARLIQRHFPWVFPAHLPVRRAPRKRGRRGTPPD